MRVYVNQKDIMNGVVGHCTYCPLALALYRKTGKRWSVGCEYASYGGKNFKMSQKTRLWVEHFDTSEFIDGIEVVKLIEPFHAHLSLEKKYV